MSTNRPQHEPLGKDLREILDKEEAKNRPARARLRALIRRRPGIAAAARSLRDLAPKRRLNRVQSMLIFALQCSLAAGIAFWFAVEVIGHDNPFFAPIAGVVSLGVSAGKRLRRGFELVLGASLGIGIGDLIVRQIGTGYWQISAVVFVGIVIAAFVDRGSMVATQAANTGVLVATILPPGSAAAFDRMLDALIGGVIGLLVMAIVPRSPLRAARRELSSLIAKAALVLDEVAAGVELGDSEALEEALEMARGTQGVINDLESEAKGATEVVAISPLYWSARRHSKSMNRALEPVQNLARNVRLLTRRAVTMVEDKEEIPEDLTELIREISDSLGHLSAIYAYGGTRGTRHQAETIPDVVRRLQRLAGTTDPAMITGQGLSGLVVLAQCRSVIVDSLMICGYSDASATASLTPTVKHPYHPPELWPEENDDHDNPNTTDN